MFVEIEHDHDFLISNNYSQDLDFKSFSLLQPLWINKQAVTFELNLPFFARYLCCLCSYPDFSLIFVTC